MSFVFEIGITEKNNKEIEKKETVEVIASKGIIGDRYFKDFNGDREQITLIESENIDYYNKTFNTNFNYLQFRRNIITKGIELNHLVDKMGKALFCYFGQKLFKICHFVTFFAFFSKNTHLIFF